MTPAHPHPSHGAEHDGGHAHHAHHGTDGNDGQAEILDLDAEVLSGHTASVIARLPLTAAPDRIVDLGCGTGAGTFALLDRFPGARVTAVDASAGHLQQLRERADALGTGGRVRTVRADLDAPDPPDLGTPDLVWASASLHHLAHPDAVLRTVHRTLAPGGLLAVVEPAGFPRFLPVDAPADRPGLEERLHALADGLHAERMPHRGADWGPLLTTAGFTVEDTRTIALDIPAAPGDAIGRYALAALRRLRATVAGTLGAEDLDALDRLLDLTGPQSVLRRADLALRTERTIWAARRS
ncbi:Trans-aconitate 2-methyltransferase [Streptomyces sp. enrichment culture]|uniref:class I SAM-dependent methyltransferase n=1 Tax=Streptomyces sp. enrichment culture TaxID=1795815 RepID=UPI003F57C899